MTFSVIIPVLNEAPLINETIARLLQIALGSDIEVIVVDGDVHGRTVKAITHVQVIPVVAGQGRGIQMNRGASVSKGDVLLFLHADTELPAHTFEAISSLLESGEYVGGAFDLGIQSDRWIFRIIETAASLRSRITRMPYGDQAIFVRRACFEDFGGFPEIPLMEDVAFMRGLKKSGYKIGIIPLKVLTSARRWEQEGVLFCTLRNWALIFLYLLGVAPERLERFYYRHRYGQHGIKTS
jgi:rSAM/selenodomain-associated transferase 2